jgi:hypothetical protein
MEQIRKSLVSWVTIILAIVAMVAAAAVWASEKHDELAAQNFITGAQTALITGEVQANTAAIKSLETKIDKLIYLLIGAPDPSPKKRKHNQI